MPTIFEEKKKRVIEQLEVDETAYTDRSPKGSIDAGIRTLVDEINSIPSLVTTSSCAGRISVYVEGRTSKSVAQDQEASSEVVSSGGKGGGKWLFVSHEPLRAHGSLSQHFGFKETVEKIPNSLSAASALIHFKFEAMILHLLAASLEDAKYVLAAGNTAGFRESGAMGITPNKDGSFTPMVGIRSNGLGLDSIIGYIDQNGEPVCIVSEDHLNLLNNIATERFTTNKDRIERFRDTLLAAYNRTGSTSTAPHTEDAATRRERKRAEGLARQQALKAENLADFRSEQKSG